MSSRVRPPVPVQLDSMDLPSPLHEDVLEEARRLAVDMLRNEAHRGRRPACGRSAS